MKKKRSTATPKKDILRQNPKVDLGVVKQVNEFNDELRRVGAKPTPGKFGIEPPLGGYRKGKPKYNIEPPLGGTTSRHYTHNSQQ